MDVSFEWFIMEKYIDYLALNGIKTPTEIQQKIMLPIWEGHDVIGVSKTGTGKTLAYLLPVMSKIKMDVKYPQVFIITPTHELAAQVFNQCKLLCLHAFMPSPALIIGGANIKRQIDTLKEKPRIIIGSAGRILELIKLKKISSHYVKTIVLDEGDRLLDKFNIESVTKLMKTTQKDRQLVFISASFDNESIIKANELGKNPLFISSLSKSSIPNEIKHIYFVCQQRDKIEILRKIVHGENVNKGLVFLNNADTISNVVKRLNYHNIKAGELSGSNFPKQRRLALSNFREEKITLLVTSDLGARGLDIKNLNYVINIDVPENPSFYLHRCGRTGRMGTKGTSITIATEHEIQFIKKYEKKFNIKIEKKQMKYGHIVE